VFCNEKDHVRVSDTRNENIFEYDKFGCDCSNWTEVNRGKEKE